MAGSFITMFSIKQYLKKLFNPEMILAWEVALMPNCAMY
jgi:hypothetical protein